MQEALRATFYATIREGVAIPVLAKLSCGVCSGAHRYQINKDDQRLVNIVLQEEVVEGVCRGRFFREVVIPEYP